MNIYPVILCGGSGTRLWPMSRGGYPKQYLQLVGNHTLLQQTALRLNGIKNVRQPIVVTNSEQRFLVAQQLSDIAVSPSSIVLEPVGRNTAPATAVASLLATEISPDSILLVLPADHIIRNDQIFVELATAAAEIAKDGHLITFGIRPTEPHTGYGYVRCGKSLNPEDGVYVVEDFVEKPDSATASRFLKDGCHLWNSGMFMLRASTYLDELRHHAPAVLDQCEAALTKSTRDLDFIRLDRAAFETAPNVSIDYAVMEKTERAVVVAATDLGWSDVGSWDALAAVAPIDPNENSLIGDVLIEKVNKTYIRAEHRMVAAIGVDNLIIIETADAVLVATKDKSQDVKKVVARLAASGRQESITHRKVFRPWGSYEGIDRGDRFQVKRIIVNPNSSLSLQMHHHRAEHWIVVRGTAKVFNGDKEMLLSENQSTYIPIGATHRLENPGKIPLELIEVQSGSYLGEDDIVRFEDHYGRAS